MWPFSKKWSPPDPQLAMVIGCSKEDLPSLLELANPAGADGAVPGMAGPADGKPTAENMSGPLQEGNYFGISPEKGGCGLQVQRVAPDAQPLSLDADLLEESGLTEETLAKFNQPAWRVVLALEQPGKDVLESVVFATRLAQRLAALTDGIVMDTAAYRFFGPTGWPVEEPIGEFDIREHVHVHIVPDLGWLHTHGLIKFGRPEMEMYDAPQELTVAALATLLDLSQYTVTSLLIQPGQTCGDPRQPFYAREATKNPDHWNHLPVLELVDLDERRKPVSSDAIKALQFSVALESEGGDQ